jgi:4,4'-diaponeurosporenoate glycosyltransferase
MPFIVLVLFLFAGVFLLWRMPRPESGGRGTTVSDVSVIIPARDEAHRIIPLLESLRAQSPAPREVIVVDDGSTDDTAAIARGLGARVMAATDRPEGWNGKTWACWQGAQKSHGEILLFLDADTWLLPNGLAALIGTYRAHGGLVAVQPYHVTVRAYEQISAFFNMVVLAGLNAFTPLGRRFAPRGAFGPCMICSRADYGLTGGHAAVRAETLEDIPMGKRFHAAGLSVSLFAGRGVIHFRMYPGGPGELIEGFSKGFGYGALSIHPLVALLVAAWITGCFGASAALLRAIIGAGPAPQIMRSLALYLAYAAHIGWTLYRTGRYHAWTVLLFPIPLVAFALIMLRSLIMTRILGRVRWKGHTISTRNGAGRDP